MSNLDKTKAQPDLFQSRDRVPSPEPEPSAGARAKAGQGGKLGGVTGVFREENRGAVLKGRKPKEYDTRKYRYDVTVGRGKNLPFFAGKEDRLSAEVAGDFLDRLHKIFGLDREVEGVLRAVDKAIFFSHTINGASVLAEGRSTFSVPGVTQPMQWKVVIEVLGVEQRRFFRAFADDIAVVNGEVIRDYDPDDVEKSEQFHQLMQVATNRGMQRYPHLAHDSADACSELSPGERAALAASKQMVIGSVYNSADRMKANDRSVTADAASIVPQARLSEGGRESFDQSCWRWERVWTWDFLFSLRCYYAFSFGLRLFCRCVGTVVRSGVKPGRYGRGCGVAVSIGYGALSSRGILFSRVTFIACVASQWRMLAVQRSSLETKVSWWVSLCQRVAC